MCAWSACVMLCIGPSAHLPAVMPPAYTHYLSLSLLNNCQILRGLNPDSPV